MNVKVILIELGKFLKETDERYDNFCHVYDKKHGYFNKRMCYVPSLYEAKEIIKEYVFANKNCYGIASYGWVADEDIEDRNELFTLDLEKIYHVPVEGEPYDVQNVRYSLANFGTKKKPQYKENFIERPKRKES